MKVFIKSIILQNAKHELQKQTRVRFNAIRNNTQTGTLWSAHSVQPCMVETPTDNFFFLKLADGKYLEIDF
jgi:hypothetical protein